MNIFADSSRRLERRLFEEVRFVALVRGGDDPG
jgi:hypothetical protein